MTEIEGAPPGTAGISLFVVPKIRVSTDGSLAGPSDVVCSGIEHKCGLHAAPTAALTFGGRDACIGYLCGEKDKGLAHMFQMMNDARINSAVSGMTMAGSAYRNALAYVQDRVQGRDIAEIPDNAFWQAMKITL
jgi:alkylation response protein AidB-like acyl-CoA dehydrogenase